MKFTTAATAIITVAAAAAPAIVHARISGANPFRGLAKGGNGGGGNGGGKPSTEEEPIDCKPTGFCTAQYKPVCGVDKETYGNECVASNACVDVAYQGECRGKRPPKL